MVVLLAAGCATDDRVLPAREHERAVELEHATEWPEADALFHRDPRWRGADAAFSVALGGDRVLWLFGDTFVVRAGSVNEAAGNEAAAQDDVDLAHATRRDCAMVRNSVALQTGLDPSTARIEFAWGPRESSWLTEEGDHFFWPQHGLRVPGGALVLCFSRMRNTPGVGLGFEALGWKAVAIDEPDRPLAEWRVRELDEPELPAGLVAAQGLNVVGEHVVGLALREPGDHAGFLVRFPLAEFARGELANGELWCRELWCGEPWHGEWRGEWRAATRELAPTPVLADAGAESSLHFDRELERWVHVRSLGFGATTLVASFAGELTGPWTEPCELFTPAECSRARPFVYAGKAHPELSVADLVLTYATNSFDFGELVADESLYYPRFVRVAWRAE